MALAELIGKQNPDGGWPYKAGSSWTEPTVYALLAACADETSCAATDRGFRWLAARQRSDGGWAPHAGVDESTWVTSLVLLLGPERIGRQAHARGVEWLMRLTGRESTFPYRLREFLLGNPVPEERRFAGWPWFPGTAAWVGPTSLAILALQTSWRRSRAPELLQRMDWGRRFLLTRMCREGGWNHGSVRALGQEGLPYPETTGLALLALRGVRSPQIAKGIAVAESFMGSCHSTEGVSWLHLGLMAHGRLPAGCNIPVTPCRNFRDEALYYLAGAAARGRNVFLA